MCYLILVKKKRCQEGLILPKAVLIVAASVAREKNRPCWRGDSSHLNFDVCIKPDESDLKMAASP